MNDISSKLLKEVKIKCGITWENQNTNDQITSIIQDGLIEFNDRFGDVDVENPGAIHKLFLAYCKYSYYDQEEDFYVNYAGEILSERMKYEVNFYENKKKNSIS